MTDLPPEVPVENVAEDVLPDDGPDPEEFRVSERERTSEATGTVYTPTGEPDLTPSEEVAAEDDEE